MENNQQQHLDLIAEMINTARSEFNDRSFIYLIWGWAVFIASLSQYALIKMNVEYNFLGWAILMPLAAVAQMIGLRKQKRKERIKTMIDKVSGYLWTALGVCFGITLFSGNLLQLNAYPVLILLYGIGTFVSGGIMDLKPMVIGGVCCWVIALVAFHTGFEIQLLLLALSIMVSYIIPGYILKNRFKQNV